MKKRKASILVCIALLAAMIIPLSANAQASIKDNAINYDGVIYHVPPRNWNPITASDEELALYDYPARPTDQKQLVQWKQIVSTQWVAPKFKAGKSHTKIDQKVSATSYSYNWSGIEANSTSTRAIGEWVQPSITADSSHLPSWSVYWAGIGGDNSAPLIQAGSDGDIDSNSTHETYLFWEIVGTSSDTGGEKLLTSLPEVNPGDYVYVDVSFNYNSSSSQYQANFYVANLTQNKSTSFSKPINSGADTSSFTTSEWIAERQAFGSSFATNMTDWGTVNFRDCQYGSYGGSTSLISSSDPNLDYLIMENTSGDYMAFPGTIGSDANFTDSWMRYN